MLDLINKGLAKYNIYVEKVGSYYHLVLSDDKTVVIKLTSMKDCKEILDIIQKIEEKKCKKSKKED